MLGRNVIQDEDAIHALHTLIDLLDLERTLELPEHVQACTQRLGELAVNDE